MSRFEILCVTMNQADFSKIHSMNIHSDVVFANQTNKTNFEILSFDGHVAKMISTETCGVGVNRNLSLIYASADICLFADDDIKYKDDVERIVLSEFDSHPDADVFIFNLESVGTRTLKVRKKTQKCSKILKKMAGGAQIAFRLSSVRKANLWFTTLFGGGCVFPCGEDGKWLFDAYEKKLNVYVSKEYIGTVSFETSSWFKGFDERYYYGFGAFYKDSHPKTLILWMLYFALRTWKKSKISLKNRLLWMWNGQKGYNKLQSYEDFIKD